MISVTEAGSDVCYNPRTHPQQMSEPSTPLMRQYSAIKKDHPSALLFFRLGDFYELFFDDAVLAAKELQITLTARNKEKGMAVPMCGVPYHAAEGYISKLIRRGYNGALARPAAQGAAPWASTPLDDWVFAADHAIPLLENQFGVLSLEGFGLGAKPAAAAAAGAILYYVRSTQRGSLDHVDSIGFYER